MPKFVVTVVVETEKDKPAPTKKMIKRDIENDIAGIDFIDAKNNTLIRATKVRVRSIDFD